MCIGGEDPAIFLFIKGFGTVIIVCESTPHLVLEESTISLSLNKGLLILKEVNKSFEDGKTD